ncbi:MAG: PKD domain-containing protein [Methanomicrobiales archaeon]|nr:PKD domain-containing protein [Methanomicrobiales archaeon]
MVSTKKLLLLVLLVIGIVFIQPVFAAEPFGSGYAPASTPGPIKIVSATASPTEGTAPLTVQFKDTSRTWSMYCQWNFGDGTKSIGNPHTTSHTYPKAGKYFVNLTIQDLNYKYITSQVATITVTSPANITVTTITADVTEGCAPLTVQFSGNSTGNSTSWSWNFGDGTPTVPEQNPVHTFIFPGNYSVTLTATGLDGSGSASKQISVGCVIPVSDVTITTWTKDGEYTVAGAEIFHGGKEGRLLGITGINGTLTVTVPSGITSLYARSPVYKDSYFYEGSWPGVNMSMEKTQSATLPPVSILLNQKVSEAYIFTETDNNTTVSLKKGSTLLLKLGENGGSTGYLWVLTTTSGLNVIDDSFVSSGTCDGCGGTRIWEMNAGTTGQQQIVAVSKQSWMPTTGQEKTFLLTINVE